MQLAISRTGRRGANAFPSSLHITRMGTQWSRCELCCQASEGALYREEMQAANEFQRADTANVTAAEEELGDASFGSLILFQRAQDSMVHPASLPAALPLETSDQDDLQRLNDLLALVRKEQELLESEIQTEQSKLQEEREEMEREKKAVEALLRPQTQPAVLWGDHSPHKKPFRGRNSKDQRSFTPKQPKGIRRFSSSPQQPKR